MIKYSMYDMQELVQARPNSSKLVQTHPNSSKLVQTCPNSSKLVQTRPNLSKLVQTCPNSSKLVQTRPNSSKLVQTRPNSSKLPNPAESVVSDFLNKDNSSLSWKFNDHKNDQTVTTTTSNNSIEGGEKLENYHEMEDCPLKQDICPPCYNCITDSNVNKIERKFNVTHIKSSRKPFVFFH